jgi:hypothetical protein
MVLMIDNQQIHSQMQKLILMTPFIQSFISNQAQMVDRIPIRDAVKPVGPIMPEPIRRYTPTSQKDQSHSVPP